MRKYLGTTLACLFLSTMMLSSVYAEKNVEQQNPDQNQQQPKQQEVQLNEQQKAELAKMHKDILEKKKEMINKYVEFGVIPEEKAQMMISHFEKHYEMLEQNGFVWKMHSHHKGPHQNKDGEE